MDLKQILKDHADWLNGNGGKKADLRNADLRNADLRNVLNIFYPIACPESGSFIGWRKAGGMIVKLQITDNAKRCSATGRKCRCSEALVLEIQNYDGSISKAETVCSDHDHSFVSRIGEIVTEPNFNDDRWEECTKGIHFFITREEAVRY